MAAGAQDVFEIYLWSVKTGRLLEILSGHEGPVVRTQTPHSFVFFFFNKMLVVLG